MSTEPPRIRSLGSATAPPPPRPRQAWANCTYDDKLDMAGFKLETLHPVIRNIIALFVAMVSVFRTFTRPGLTWGLLGFLGYVWARSSGVIQAELSKEITFTALFLWFGARPTKAESGK